MLRYLRLLTGLSISIVDQLPSHIGQNGGTFPGQQDRIGE